MQILKGEEVNLASGGMNWEGNRQSTNVIDLQGASHPNYIDANGMCWALGTPSSTMYPNGQDTDPTPAGSDGDE